MRRINYDQEEVGTGNTATHFATDVSVEQKFGNMQNAYKEGFIGSDDQRMETVAVTGRPPQGDEPMLTDPSGVRDMQWDMAD
ncbi:MAG TPA: hypothetical protein VFT64_05405 [Rickettsiales bacterium]|nr:hypothetical protein [Rickettsiales bacterium]